MNGFKSFRLLASTAAVALCTAGAFAPVSYAAQPAAAAAPAAAAPATPPPQRELGPPPGAGEGLEDGAPPPPPPPPAQAKPLVPVNPAQAKPANVNTQPSPEEGTRLLLGEIEILDIPLNQIPNYRDSMRDIVIRGMSDNSLISASSVCRRATPRAQSTRRAPTARRNGLTGNKKNQTMMSG